MPTGGYVCRLVDGSADWWMGLPTDGWVYRLVDGSADWRMGLPTDGWVCRLVDGSADWRMGQPSRRPIDRRVINAELINIERRLKAAAARS